MIAEAAFFPDHFGEQHPVPPEVFRDSHQEVASVLQLVEVLLEETVLLVVQGSPLHAPR